MNGPQLFHTDITVIIIYGFHTASIFTNDTISRTNRIAPFDCVPSHIAPLDNENFRVRSCTVFQRTGGAVSGGPRGRVGRRPRPIDPLSGKDAPLPQHVMEVPGTRAPETQSATRIPTLAPSTLAHAHTLANFTVMFRVYVCESVVGVGVELCSRFVCRMRIIGIFRNC